MLPAPVGLDLVERDSPAAAFQPRDDLVHVGVTGLALDGLLEAEVDQLARFGCHRVIARSW
jgi:hypothetical protein